ncbi:MAG TPA: DUF748 domain-containing protein [Flavitalea sp.]|nr:DUF748 domain-containing protein [Flavitalea sp.]
MATKPGKNRPGSFFRLKATRTVLIVVAILIIIRLILPYVVLHYANKTLANVPGYYGHIEDIDLSLYRGAYQIDSIYLNKKDSSTGKQTDFFSAGRIDLSVEWKALFHGSLVGELELDRPSLIFTKDKTELGDVKKDTNDFRQVLDKFMPLNINRFEIRNGRLRYDDHGSKPKVDLTMKEIYVLAKNLKNSYDSTQLLPASVTASARAYEGTLDLNMRLNPLAKVPVFDLNAELKNTNLVLLNDFMQAYGNFDVNKGRFGLYTELAAKDGKFEGYVKPVIKDLDVRGKEDKKDSFFHKIWESLVGAVGVVFRNQKKDQIATRVRLEGSFKDPKTNTIDAIWEVLRNAFIQALVPSVDNQINIASLDKDEKKDDRNLIQRIFNGNKDKKEERREKRQERKERKKNDK